MKIYTHSLRSKAEKLKKRAKHSSRSSSIGVEYSRFLGYNVNFTVNLLKLSEVNELNTERQDPFLSGWLGSKMTGVFLL